MKAMLRKDPYRLLFPLALWQLVAGLLLWLPYLSGGDVYPVREHMQLLMRGSMYGFIFGFLLTFLPHVWQAMQISLVSLVLMAINLICMPVWILSGQYLLFELCLLMNWLLFSYHVWRIFPWQQRSPMHTAIACVTLVGLSANVMQFFISMGVVMPVWFMQWMSALSLKGVILLYVFALVPFLLQRFQGKQSACEKNQTRAKPWWLPMPVVAMFSLTYVLPDSLYAVAIIIRSVVLLVSFSEALPLLRWPIQGPWFLKGIWLSLWCIIIGHVLPLFAPAHQIVWNHIMYIPGLLQLCLLVAARVVCAHAQDLDHIQKDKWTIVCIVLFLFVSVLSRVGVDWAPDTRVLHLYLAAAFALAAMLLWLVRYGRLLVVAGPRPT